MYPPLADDMSRLPCDLSRMLLDTREPVIPAVGKHRLDMSDTGGSD
jgi:hypothetical protein